MKYIAVIVSIFLLSCQTQGNESKESPLVVQKVMDYQQLDTATFAGGCFWCVEASFEQIQGVFFTSL